MNGACGDTPFAQPAESTRSTGGDPRTASTAVVSPRPDGSHRRGTAAQHAPAENVMATQAEAKSKRVEVNPYHLWHARF